MALLWWSVRHFFSWRTAIITVLLIGLSSDWWYQSLGLMSEVGAGAFLILALCFTLENKPFPSACALGISILFRPTNLLGLPIWTYVLINRDRKRLLSIIPIMFSLGILGLFNWLRFESPLISDIVPTGVVSAQPS